MFPVSLRGIMTAYDMNRKIKSLLPYIELVIGILLIIAAARVIIRNLL